VAQWSGISLANKIRIGNVDDHPKQVWNSGRSEILKRLDVVNHLGHEESATLVLLGQQSQMFVISAAVALWNRDAPDRQVGGSLHAAARVLARAM